MDLTVSFTCGFCIYPLLEILWRGYSHPTMCFAGGLCTMIIYAFNKKNPDMNIFIKGFFCALFITLIELLFGIAFNIFLKYEVWDYSSLPFNFMGQICPLYSLIWYIVSIVVIQLYNRAVGLYSYNFFRR